MSTKLSDVQVMQKCFEIAIKNGWDEPEDIILLAEMMNRDPYWYLYNMKTGFAKALFGDGIPSMYIDHNGKEIKCKAKSYKYHLQMMVGTDPIVYLYNWLKEKEAVR